MKEMKFAFQIITLIATINLNSQNHSEEWDFYLCRIDDKPASIYLDLGLNEIAAQGDRANLFWVSVQMNNPREDGLSSDTESKKLWEIEDLIVGLITSKHDAIYAGRLTNDGKRDFYFYFEKEQLLDKSISEIMVRFPEYSYDYGIKENDNWESYLSFLYPSPRELQSILNRRVLEQLQKHGDDLTKSRIVDHWIYFKSDIDRTLFEKEIIQRNFTIKTKDFDKQYSEYPFKLQISREDKVGWDEIDEYTIELWELANQFNGDYDGWECPILKKD